MARKNETKAPVAVPCWDKNSRTCIEVGRDGGNVRYLQLSLDTVFTVKELPEADFDEKFEPIKGYHPEKAFQNYVEFSRKLGATDEALEILAAHITIPTDVRSEIMAAASKRSAASAAKTSDKPEKPSAKAKVKPKLKSVDKPKVKREPGEKRESAAQMFQDLIMEGKQTDDQIFKKVQAKYGLDDSKRGYTKWYRGKLIKDGKKPPAAK